MSPTAIGVSGTSLMSYLPLAERDFSSLLRPLVAGGRLRGWDPES